MMKTLNYPPLPDKCHAEDQKKYIITGKFLKPILAVYMLSCIMFLSSCMIGFRTHRHERPGGIIEHRDHDQGRHGQDDHPGPRGQDDHHD
jgi:hypothetical protein